MYFKMEQSLHTLKTIVSCFCLLYFCSLGWASLAELGLSPATASGPLPSCSRWASRCCTPRAVSTGSGHMCFRSCGSRAQLPCVTWNLPGPGVRPMPPLLAGGFLATGPPGKSWKLVYYTIIISLREKLLWSYLFSDLWQTCFSLSQWNVFTEILYMEQYTSLLELLFYHHSFRNSSSQQLLWKPRKQPPETVTRTSLQRFYTLTDRQFCLCHTEHL